jgi:succinoglycan biosynthesis protein ExoO
VTDVSVIVAAYNAEDCIKRAIKSVCSQTLRAIEIIVIDDGSQDRTVPIVRALAAEEPRLRLHVSAANGGPAAARNIGLDMAEGRWIATLDADDAYLPDRLAKLVALGEARQLDMMFDNLLLYDWAAAAVIGPALSHPRPGEASAIDAHAFVAQSITGRSRFDYGQLKPIVRRAFLAHHGVRYPAALRHGEDFAFMFNMLLPGARAQLVGDAYYLFTQRVGSASGVASGLSRTISNLEAMRAHSLALLDRPRVKADPALARLVRRRAEAIRWHQAWSSAYPYLHARQPLRLGREVGNDWSNGLMLLRHLVRRGATAWRG